MTAEQVAKDYIVQILSKHVGEVNKIKRKHLLSQINQSYGLHRKHITDRKMRDLIEELRPTGEGFRIVSTMNDGGGYFFAENPDEGEECIKPDKKRAYTMLTNRNAQEKLMNDWRYSNPQTEMKI